MSRHSIPILIKTNDKLKNNIIMKTIYNLRLFMIAIIAMMATSAFAQDSLPVTLSFNSDGGTKSIDIAETPVNWKLTCDASWVHLSPAEGIGAAKVTITVDTNATESERNANILLDTGYGLVNNLFLVKQKGKVDAAITNPNSTTPQLHNSVIRTLSGMKVKATSQRHGIYIINGKKVMK
jgi:hypothetical protein